MIEDSLQHFNQRNVSQPIAGTWDLSKYGLRPVPLAYIDNYKRNQNIQPVYDNIPQNTVKPEGSLVFKENQSPTAENLGMHPNPAPNLPTPPQGRFGGMFFTPDNWIDNPETSNFMPNLGGATVKRLFRNAQ